MQRMNAQFFLEILQIFIDFLKEFLETLTVGFSWGLEILWFSNDFRQFSQMS